MEQELKLIYKKMKDHQLRNERNTLTFMSKRFQKMIDEIDAEIWSRFSKAKSDNGGGEVVNDSEGLGSHEC